jgi:hypothetical protein
LCLAPNGITELVDMVKKISEDGIGDNNAKQEA